MASKARRKSGSGKFPPNPTQWDAERNGLAFRSRFKLDAGVALEPFLRTPENVELVATRDALAQYVDELFVRQLYDVHGRRWSGMTIPCEGHFIIMMNETHSDTRKNATLMEELFHIILEHKPSRVGACPHTGIVKREFDRKMETEAYHSAAAALVPYFALKSMVVRGDAKPEIASHFGVSNKLVSFRLNVCKLYRKFSNRTPK